MVVDNHERGVVRLASDFSLYNIHHWPQPNFNGDDFFRRCDIRSGDLNTPDWTCCLISLGFVFLDCFDARMDTFAQQIQVDMGLSGECHCDSAMDG